MTVYTEEAHSKESWVFPSNSFQYEQHKNLDDRIAAAKDIFTVIDNIPFPVVVDSMDNEAMETYGVRPMRMCIVLDGRLVFYGGLGPIDYKVDDATDWLKKFRNSAE